MDAFKQAAPYDLGDFGQFGKVSRHTAREKKRSARARMRTELEFIRDEYAPGAIERLELSIDGVRVAVDVPREAEEA